MKGCLKLAKGQPITVPVQSILGVMLFAHLLAGLGCGGLAGVGSSSSGAAPKSINGIVSAGPVNGATVKAYALNVDGSRGNVLGTSQTNSEGQFTINLELQDGPVEFVATGGSYREEASNNLISVGSAQLRLLLPNFSAPRDIGITPLTEMAAQLALATITSNRVTSLASIIYSSNSVIGGGMGISDITQMPSDPNQPARNARSTEAAQYAVVLATLSQVAQVASSSSGSAINSLDITQALALSFVYNGGFRSNVVMESVTLDIPVPNALGLNINLTEIFNNINSGSNNFASVMSAAMGIYLASQSASTLGYGDPVLVPPPTFVSSPSYPSGRIALVPPAPPISLPNTQPNVVGFPLMPRQPVIAYASDIIFIKGSAIIPVSPTSSGTVVTSCTADPSLPAGITLSPACSIAGTPSAVTVQTLYRITATDAVGATSSITLNITVKDVAPTNLAYEAMNSIYVPGIAITPNAPSNEGGSVVSYSVSPSLPAGLTINSQTGVISGSPSSTDPETTYTVTAVNSGGSATVHLVIWVSDAPSITSISPTSGSTGSVLSIVGTNFVSGAKVWLEDLECLNVTFQSSTQIACVVPRSDLISSLRVKVANPNGTWSTENIDFRFSGFVGNLQFSVGDSNACLNKNGGAWCWGSSNTYGTLGNGTTGAGSMVPVQVTGLDSGVQAIDIGWSSACAIVNGGAWCWGSNSIGKLGAPSISGTSSVPVAVRGLSSGVQSISVGAYSVCAVVNEEVWCWGHGAYGITGTLNGPNDFFPQKIAGFPGPVKAISVGMQSACAIVKGGSVWCWGKGTLGSNLGQSATPVQVTGLTSGAQSLSVGRQYACAVVSGSAWCWGINEQGQLGDNTTEARANPVQVQGLTGQVQAIAVTRQQISPGGSTTCAVVSGAVKCWGNNSHGQIGNGTINSSINPVQVSGLTSGAVSVTASSAVSCAVVSGGAKCWGFNYAGELGTGSTSGLPTYGSSVPVNVFGISSGIE